MTIVRTSSKGQVVIPKKIREALGITPGRKVLFRVVGDHAEMIPIPENQIKALRGILKGQVSAAKELLSERQKDMKIDEEHTL